MYRSGEICSENGFFQTGFRIALVEVLEKREMSVLKIFEETVIPPVIAAKFLLDDVPGISIPCGNAEYRIKEYTTNTYDECLISLVRARNGGASASSAHRSLPRSSGSWWTFWWPSSNLRCLR